ncbi:MAG: TatD family hydrolase [Flavobacteriaceae bacterium]|jgi:TatD DNase family protein|nr:TatD family hydrolase [Flavobacteriaceae bacterium]
MSFYNLHTHKYSDNPFITELVNQYPWEFNEQIPLYSIGIHPWYIDKNRLEDDLKMIDEKLSLKNCLALGECGLDKRIAIPLALQIEVFRKQILLAEKHKKPLVLHLVAAFQELIEIKNEMKISVPIIIHGFSKNKQLAQQLLQNDFYLSFGKYLLRNPELKETFLAVPNDRFFLETDTVEESIFEVYELAAQYKELKPEELQRQINENWKLFDSATK